jgi:hypothetical protein
VCSSDLKPQDCRDWAINNFSLDKVAKMYEEYFQAVLNIHGGKGWYEENNIRNDLDYNYKAYPGHTR